MKPIPEMIEAAAAELSKRCHDGCEHGGMPDMMACKFPPCPCRTAAEAALNAALAVMPIPITEAMLNAARDWSYKKYGKPIGNDDAIGCWKAMWAAMPLPDPPKETA